MQKQLQILMELQNVDFQLLQLERERGDLPQIVNTLKDEIEKLTETHDAKSAEREDTLKQKLLVEGELQTTQEKLKKFQAQLYSVATNKEYDAITVEIESAEQNIDAMETSILEMEEREENLQKETDELVESLKQKKDELEKNESDLKKKLAETEEEERRLAIERAELVKKITRPVISRYQRIFQAKNGNAVVPVVNNACSGCFTRVPPQRALEIRKMDHLILCETCGRILMWQDENKEAVQLD